MSTTTQILFNSPALHSLKRDQLVKLCKIHSIKASGKNVDLINKLKQHASTLPKDAPLSIAARSEDAAEAMDVDEQPDSDKENRNQTAYRPSEQWEMVMDSIAETDEAGSSQGTVSTKRGEFGTASSRGTSTTVTSSIRALASSLGIKRSTSSKSVFNLSTSNSASTLPPVVDELSLFSAPYSMLPDADPNSIQTDHFTFDPTPTILKRFDFQDPTASTPLPGHALRPGVPAPENARLSMGLRSPAPTRPSGQPTTTLRLVSNPTSLKKDTPDASPSTPLLKPFPTSFDLVMGSPSATPFHSYETRAVSLYPDLTPELPSPTRRVAEVVAPAPMTPDLPTNASSMAQPAAPELFVFGSPAARQSTSAFKFTSPTKSNVIEDLNKRLEADGVARIDASLLINFRAKANDSERDDDRVIKPLPRQSGASDIKGKFDRAHAKEFDKMESIASYAARRAAASSSKTQASSSDVRVGQKRKSNALGDETQQPRRPTGAGSQASQARVISNGRRKAGKIPGAFGDDDEDVSGNEDGDRDAKKPRVEFDDENRNLAAEQARLAREREAIKKKLEQSRARRRSSAANAGRTSMGNRRMSRGNLLQKSKPEAKASRFGFISSAAKSLVRGVWGLGKGPAPSSQPTMSKASATTNSTSKSTPAPPTAEKKQANAAPTVGSSKSQLRVPSARLGTINSLASTSSSRSRSPIPTFNSTTRTRSSNAGTTSTRTSSVASRADVGNSATRTSSMASRASIRNSSINTRNPPIVDEKKRVSRLLAPTASSLAKINPSATSEAVKKPEPLARKSIAKTSVFSKPLLIPQGSGLPSPVRPAPQTSNDKTDGVEPLPVPVTRQRTVRKPRISRSKVIAKLASQRAAASAVGARRVSASRFSVGGAGRVRSSMGTAKAQRKSVAGGRRSHAEEADILMSAKKRARQSEYMRRKSRALLPAPSSTTGNDDMAE